MTAAVPAQRRGELLEVRDAVVGFAGVLAVDHVSLTAQPGKIHTVLGPNGAGKSTLFNLVSGFYTPAEGEIRYGGHVLTGRRPHQIARLGVARTFQNLELSAGESVLDNIQLGCHLNESPGVLRACVGWAGAARSERRSREHARAMAELVGLADFVAEPCGRLPYGVRKRVEIARALASSPGLLLLDEPVAGMTADEVAAMQEVLAQVHDATGLTILLIEHDVEFALGLADEVTVIDFGKVIACGSAEEIRAHPAVIEAYLGTGPADDELATTTGGN
ncbi:ABC transporter ATP-binding protein [Amycolatopsis sp. A1MSW2902]|uniref:ABC transporter ATP-binding protein n=1 Tax=Amycolatopsis sp. A1MSW2902 TaxID=687413 RepID=UPI00307FAD32